MATRRERVVLEADVTQFNTAMAQAAARVAALQRDVDRLDGTRVRVDVDTSGFAAAATQAAALRAQLDDIGRMRLSPSVTASFTQITRQSGAANRAVGQTSDSINQLTGRLSLAVDAALLLAPALVPIGAVGAQALGGLTAAATAAAVAGGSAIVAFQGLGDAVTAVQEYQLDPTIAGLEKAQEAMDSLPVAAQRFVVEFQKFRPVLGEIRAAAAEGWFPGLTESLDKFAELGPRIEDIFFRAGEAGGFLVDQAAGSLASERWAPFLDFLEREVPTAMGSLARTVGDLAHGLTEMLMAFDPGNDSFLAWLEGVADGFDRWASSAEAQESIEGLLRYARENGPEVAALFTSLVGALSAIVQAAAPLGGPVLEGLTAVTEMIRIIADSDIATPILAGVAALRLFNRLQATAIAGAARVTGPTPAIITRDPNATFGPMTAAQAAFVAQQNRVARQQAAAARRAQMVTTGTQGAALIGAVALASSGLTEEMEGANAASMALLGTMVAPGWGTAAGALVGTFMDIAGVNDSLMESFERTQSAIDTLDFSGSTASLAASRDELDAYAERVNTINPLSLTQSFSTLKNSVEGLFGDSDVEEAEAEYARLERQMFRSQQAVASLGEAMGIQVGEVDGSARSIAELNRVLELAQPAMDQLGITAKDLALGEVFDDLARSDGLFGAIGDIAQGAGLGADRLAAAIARQGDYMDSTAGKTDNFRSALASLVREEGTAEERAKGLSEALDQLLSPRLDAEEALSQVREMLNTISNLDAGGGFTVKNAVGRENLAETRAYARAVQERLVTMVNAKRSEEDVARALSVSRDQFIKSGVAAGFSADQMRRRANVIGLTPKLVETTFRELGISEVDRKVWALRDQYNKLPKEVRTRIRNEGIPQSIGEAKRLADQLELTAKERRALLRLVTEGEGNIAAARRLMDSVQSKTVELRINEIRTTSQRTLGRVGGRADGGMIPKDGGPYEDKYLYMLAPGEEVISNRYGQADRFRADRDAGRIPGYADGGTVGGSRLSDLVTITLGGSTLSDLTTLGGKPADVGGEADRAARGLKALRKELRESTSELQRERSRRAELVAGLKANFTGDPFAAQGGVWSSGGGMDPISTLLGDVGDLRQYRTIVGRLKKRGLNGGALAEADTLEEAQILNGMNAADLRRYESLYNQRQRLASSVAGQYATAVTGITPADIKALQADVRRVEKAIEREGKKDRDNRDKNTRDTLSDVTHSARNAGQRRRKNRD